MADRRAEEERADRIRRAVRTAYGARIRRDAPGCCGEGQASACCGATPGEGTPEARGGCCGGHTETDAGASARCGGSEGSCRCGGHAAEGDCCHERQPQANALGYSAEELASAPAGGAVSYGCGNPGALAGLQPGETVLDLGSGGGLDCFLAARRVGPHGRVVGVDMTPEMIERARAGARSGGYDNVEFRLGEIEHLPVADASVDVIISNCVINLSPDKAAVFAEAFRVLRPGGRLIVSDVVRTAAMPEEVCADQSLWCECVSGAEQAGTLEQMLRQVGFVDVLVTPSEESRRLVESWVPGHPAAQYVRAAIIEAWKAE